jgi:hypothetical protein
MASKVCFQHSRKEIAVDVTCELLKNITVCFQHYRKENTFPLVVSFCTFHVTSDAKISIAIPPNLPITT